jgi:hypothetical protein
VISGDYCLYRPLYMTVPPRLDPVAQQFLAYLYSREGQALIRSTGTITLEEGKGLWDTFKQQMQTQRGRVRTR